MRPWCTLTGEPPDFFFWCREPDTSWITTAPPRPGSGQLICGAQILNQLVFLGLSIDSPDDLPLARHPDLALVLDRQSSPSAQGRSRLPRR